MDNPVSGNLSWHHLWFLVYLFVFSLILWPLFWYFRKKARKSLFERIAGLMEKPGAVFLPAIPLILINVTLRPIYGWGNQNLINDWANFLFYSAVLFYGFLLVSDGRILQVVRRNTLAALAAAIVFTAGIKLIETGILPLSQFAYMTFNAIACWCWLLAIIGIGSRLLNFTNRVLRYASDAVLPVYVLHQTIIVTLGFYVIKWDTGVAPKYFLVLIATLVGSLVIYEAARRTNITRFLFGMRLVRKSKPELATAGH